MITRYYQRGFQVSRLPQNKMTLSPTMGNLIRFQTQILRLRIRHRKHVFMFYQRMPISLRLIFTNGAGLVNSQPNKFGMSASFWNSSLYSISQKICQAICFESICQHASSTVCQATPQIIFLPVLWNMHVINLSIMCYMCIYTHVKLHGCIHHRNRCQKYDRSSN